MAAHGHDVGGAVGMGLMLILYVLGFFAILTPLMYLTSHTDSKTGFTTFLNEGGWKTQGLSFMIGLIGLVFTFLDESQLNISHSNLRVTNIKLQYL